MSTGTCRTQVWCCSIITGSHTSVILTGAESLEKARDHTEACIEPVRDAVCALFAEGGVHLDKANILVDIKPPRVKPGKEDRVAMSMHITVCQVSAGLASIASE